MEQLQQDFSSDHQQCLMLYHHKFWKGDWKFNLKANGTSFATQTAKMYKSIDIIKL